ncbi:hypothetical protein [Nostoc sp.]|uniref:hypothetical protein n=1 Tax=Nostoc sp. TaxID=1180 RepID=UPI002FFB4C1D
MLLFAFVSPPSLAEAKDISPSHALNEQSVTPDANLVGSKTGELLIAQRRPGRYQIIRRRQQFRERQFIRRRQPERYQNIRERQFIRRRQQFRERQFIRQRQPYGRYQNIRGRY